MKRHFMWLSILLIISLSSCSTSSIEEDTKILSGQIERIQVDCGGWGLITDEERYEVVKLPEDFKENGLKVQMKVKNRDDLSSCTMAGPIIEVLSVQRHEVR